MSKPKMIVTTDEWIGSIGTLALHAIDLNWNVLETIAAYAGLSDEFDEDDN